MIEAPDKLPENPNKSTISTPFSVEDFFGKPDQGQNKDKLGDLLKRTLMACGNEGATDDKTIRPDKTIVDAEKLSPTQRAELIKDIEKLIELGKEGISNNFSEQWIKKFNAAANEINKLTYAVKFNSVYDGIRCGGAETFFPPKDSNDNYQISPAGITIKGLHDGNPDHLREVRLEDILIRLKQAQQV